MNSAGTPETLESWSHADSGRIVGFDPDALAARYQSAQQREQAVRRMMEMGLTVGAQLTVREFGPIRRDPIAVYVRGSVVSVGREEARCVLMEKVKS